MLSLCKNPYLSLSFGKDSILMTDLVREQYPSIPCLFLCSEETMILNNYELLIEEYIELGLNIRIVKMIHEDHDFSITGSNNEFSQEAFFEGWDGMFMGLRIEESKARRISLISKKNNVIGKRIMRYSSGKRSGILRCCPVSDWTAFEVMLYIKEKRLPYFSIYDESCENRTSAQVPYEPNFMLADLKRNNISRYNELMQMIPSLKIYT